MNKAQLSEQSSSESAAPVQQIEQLVGSLRGVISVKAVTNGQGRLGKIHVLASDSVSVEQLTREIESTLLTYFDLALEPGQISVAISRDSHVAEPAGAGNGSQGEEAGWSPGAPGSSREEREAPASRTFFRQPRMPETEAAPSHGGEPAPEPPAGTPAGAPGGAQAESPGGMASTGPAQPMGGTYARPSAGAYTQPGGGGGAHAQPTGESPAQATAESRARPSGQVPGPPASPPDAGPVTFVRYTVEGDMGPAVEIRVTVQAGGEHYDGVAPASELGRLEPVLFAEAAVHAAEIALRSLAGERHGQVPGFRVLAAEEFQALDQSYMAVALSVSGPGARGTVTGFYPLADGPHRAAALAALDAIRRYSAGDGTAEPRETRRQSVDPFRVWG